MINTLLNFLLVFLFMIVFFFFAINEEKFERRQKKRILVIAVILLSILAGVRQIGTDLQAYRIIFHTSEINNYNAYFRNMFMYKLEPGFMVLISEIKRIGLGFEFFLFISALIPIWLLQKVIFKVEENFPLTVFMFFLMMYSLRGPFDIIRHFFAAMIYLSALYSLSKNNNFLYYIKTGTSTLFHYSNVMVFLIKPFLSIKWNTMRYLLLLIFSFLLGLSLEGIIVNNIEDLNFKYSVFMKLQNYLVDDYEYASISHYIFRNLMENIPVFSNIILSIIALNYKGDIYSNKFYGIVLNSLIFGTLFYAFLCGIGSYTMAIRMNFLFGIGSIFIVKEIISIHTKRKQSVLFSIIMVYLLFYNFIIFSYYSGLYKHL